MKLSFVELHTSLFHGGKNFSPPKISADKDVEMELVVKEIERFKLAFVKLTYKGKPTLIPLTSVNHVTEADGLIEQPRNTHHAMDINKFQTAQVGTPHDHVFAGAGKGKGVGRASKVQGE